LGGLTGMLEYWNNGQKRKASAQDGIKTQYSSIP
jgi:hypothetical protein